MIKCKVKRLKKIKTVYRVRSDMRDEESFDQSVNELLIEGWRIGEIKVIEAQPPNTRDVLYARLEWWEG